MLKRKSPSPPSAPSAPPIDDQKGSYSHTSEPLPVKSISLQRLSEFKQGVWQSAISSVLKKMGYSSLRPRQTTVLNTMRESTTDNFIVLLPTAGGKSLLIYIICLLYNVLLEPLEPYCTIVIVPTRPLAESQRLACVHRHGYHRDYHRKKGTRQNQKGDVHGLFHISGELQ